MPRVICPKCEEKVLIEGVAYGERAPCPSCGRTIVVRKTKDGKSAQHGAKKPLRSVAAVLRMAASCLFLLVILGAIAVVWYTQLPSKHWPLFIVGLVAIVSLSLTKYALIERGARKMDEFVSYKWAMTAAILAILDIVLFPFGIWALIVLMKSETKAAFSTGRGD